MITRLSLTLFVYLATAPGCLAPGAALELPVVEGSRTVLMLVRTGAASRLLLFDPLDARLLRATYENAAEVWLIFYATPSSEIGLIGEIGKRDLRKASCLLFAPIAAHRLRLTGDEDNAWEEVDPEPLLLELDETSAERCRPCQTWAEHQVSLDGPDGIAVAVQSAMALDASRILITTQQQAIIADRSSALHLEGCEGHYGAALVDERRRVWLGGPHAVFRVELDETQASCQVLERKSIGGPEDLALVQWLASSEDGSGQVYAMTGAGAVYRVAPGPAVLLARLPNALDDEGDRGGLIWLGPEELAASAGSLQVQRVRNDGTTGRLGGPLPSEGLLQSLRRIPGFGPVATTRRGQVYAFADDEWRRLDDDIPLGRDLNVLTSENALVVLSRAGEVHRWVEGHGFCQVAAVLGANSSNPRSGQVLDANTIVLPDITVSEFTARGRAIWLEEPQLPQDE